MQFYGLDHIVDAECQGEDISQLLNAFSRNLFNCTKKLIDLDAVISGSVEVQGDGFFSEGVECHTYYNVQVMRALTQTVLQRKGELKRRRLSMKGPHADEYLGQQREI